MELFNDSTRVDLRVQHSHHVRNLMSVTNVARATDTFDISDAAAIAIVISALMDAGLIAPEDQTKVIE